MLKNRFSLKNKKIIVLGGNGLIGSAISSLFHANGGDVIIIDKKKSKLQKKINQVICDISDIQKIEDTLKKLQNIKFNPDIFINCSYPKSNQYKDRKSIRSYKLNLNSMFTWHPDYEIYEHNLQKWQTKKYTDDINEWVASTLIRKNSKN